MSAPRPLEGIRVVSLAPNLPGPAAAHRLVQLGATVTKVEPPAGDFLAVAAPNYYAELVEGQTVVTIDLKSDDGRRQLDALLADADVLLTSSRPSALTKLGLGWDAVHGRFPRLVQVAVVGYPGEGAEVAGHDLTYQAAHATVDAPAMPRVLMADLGGAERTAGVIAAALVARHRTDAGSYHEVALSDVARDFAAPLRHGLTAPGGVLGGGLPQYGLYRTREGHVALAALEGHFWKRFREALPEVGEDGTGLAEALLTKTASEWQEWGRERDIPMAAVATLEPRVD